MRDNLLRKKDTSIIQSRPAAMAGLWNARPVCRESNCSEYVIGDQRVNQWEFIPFVLGLLGGLYVLHFSMLTSILFASLFSSHTLIAYPMVQIRDIEKPRGKYYFRRHDDYRLLSLLVLAVVVGMTQGEVVPKSPQAF